MTTNVLILCTHNSARSVLSEGMLNHWAKKLGKDVRAYSAGSAPSGRLNPFALEALANAYIDTSGYRSKSWDEFTSADAPEMRIVITVCDSACQGDVPVLARQPGAGGVTTQLTTFSTQTQYWRGFSRVGRFQNGSE
jgi:arsenate reductase